eukprot:TRINITY_DN6572_c0_g1_i2.p1 TRINITY_DN6572_c0_g1~~TRINITY_DN6572_c0_g1_i2.p1  ORF type:complete len:329 (-),score=49.08 TRINITY_DN6572_c0_g1_i2:23-1009(-)
MNYSPFLFLSIIIVLANLASSTNERLPKGLSVSGVSSGGAMAVQFHVAHSASVIGAGIIAGVPYWCAEATLQVALTACTKQPELIVIDALIAATYYAEGTLSIDSTSNLANSRVWLFSGQNDSVVLPGVMKKVQEYYTHFLNSASNIKTVFNILAEHSFVTNNYGNPCGVLLSPYLNNCDFDSAGSLLSWIYGDLNPKVPANMSNLVTIPQGDYTPLYVPPSTLSMDKNAFLYIPTGCKQKGKCAVHIAFHGCHQSVSEVGEVFVLHAGYNEWAEANNIIILYPQTIDSVVPLNPEGCWDWWGCTGLDYATKLAGQIITVKNMADAFS